MAALTRESSFERVLSSMDTYMGTYETLSLQHEASRAISSWMKKSLKLKAVYRAVDRTGLEVVDEVLGELLGLRGGLQNAQEILSRGSFVQALSHFLNCLPSDPSLRKKNKVARSVRMISSSFLIMKFPGLVLEDDGRPDTGEEAVQCHFSAKLFVVALRRFIRLLQQPSISLKQFRISLIGYRYSLRCFLTAIEAWKTIDCDRVKHSFEMAYCETFMVVWSSENVLSRLDKQLSACVESDRPSLLQQQAESQALIQSGNAKLFQFREMLKQLLGSRKSKDLLEELDAYLHSSTQSMTEELSGVESGVYSDGNPGVENVLSGNSVPSSDSTESTDSTISPLSPEATQLRRVAIMTGLGENNILHELCLNSKFKLSDPLPDLLPFDGQVDVYKISDPSMASSQAHVLEMMQRDPLHGKELLKNVMIKTIEDRFVANMTKSTVLTISEVTVGGIYPILYSAEPYAAPPQSGSPGIYTFAKVLYLNPDNASMDCQYVVDGVVVKNVPLTHVKLSSLPRDFVTSGFLSFLEDMMSKISALIPSRSDLHAQVSLAFDLDLLKQMIENDAVTVTDFIKLFSTLVSFVTKLQSPQRSTELIDWFKPFVSHCMSLAAVDLVIPCVPKFFEVLSSRLEQVQLEVANYYLSTLVPFAIKEGPAILRRTVDARIMELCRRSSPTNDSIIVETHYREYLPRTAKFLTQQLRDPPSSVVTYLKEMDALTGDNEWSDLVSAGVGCPTGTVDLALIARAFSQLLQNNVDLGSPQGSALLPETFLWDGKRLRNLKNDIDSLVLVSSLLISCRSFLLSAKKFVSSEQEIVLQNLLYEVMRDETVSITVVVTTAQNFIRKNFADTASSLPPTWESTLEEALKKCIAPSSPVFQLLSKRVHLVLVRALLDIPFTDMLNRFSMNSPSQIQQLKIILSSAKLLFSLNVKTFGPLYSSMLRLHCESDTDT